MLACSAGLWESQGVDAVVMGTGAEHPYADELRRLGYDVVISPRTRSANGLLRFASAVRDQCPDVVHVHTESMFAPMVGVARQAPSVRAVFRSIHSVFGIDSDPAYIVKRRRRLAIARAMGMHSVACSAEVAQHELATFGLRCDIIENWVDTTSMTPATTADILAARRVLSIPGNARVVTVIGNCDFPKNHELLLSALGEVTSPVVLLHVGETRHQSALEARLSAELVDRGIVRMLGRRNDIPQLITGSDAVAVPSRHEGFSMVAAEALCAGVPLLAADSPGLSWVRDFRSVRRLPSDVAAWTAALSELGAGWAPDGGLVARDRAEAFRRFSPTRGVQDWAAAYRRAASDKRTRRREGPSTYLKQTAATTSDVGRPIPNIATMDHWWPRPHRATVVQTSRTNGKWTA